MHKRSSLQVQGAIPTCISCLGSREFALRRLINPILMFTCLRLGHLSRDRDTTFGGTSDILPWWSLFSWRPDGQFELMLLQYVDDLLLAAQTEEECLAATVDLLRDLELMGYGVSAKKAQIAVQTVSYLGYVLQQGITAHQERSSSTQATTVGTASSLYIPSSI
ncbi:uncharacterized protein AAES06_020520 [Glossophaga mutica]